MPSLMTASVDSGKCGPCCSIAATGNNATVRSTSTRAKSVVRMSCQKAVGAIDDSDRDPVERLRAFMASRRRLEIADGSAYNPHDGWA